MEKLIKLKELSQDIGLCRQTIRKMSLEGNFPAPVKISERRIAWKETQVKKWKRNLEKKGGGDA